jgi:hypothetical protein
MRRIVFQGLAIFLAIVGLISVMFPFVALFIPNGSMLPLDTRAYLGAGTAVSAPSVSAVNCSAQEYGTSIRNGRLRMWNCQLTLGRAPSVGAPAKPVAPYAGMTRAEANAEFQQRLGRLAIPDIRVQSGLSSLERELPFDRSGDLPTLRRMSEPGEPPEYGVVWGGRELAARWFMWALMSLLMFAFGGAAIYAARVGWHRGTA